MEGVLEPISGLGTFVAVVDAGGFSAAASKLGLSKSAVSKQVSRLEDRLCARLLNRTTRRLALTEVGRAFYERGVRILAEVEEAERAVTELHAEPRGTLRVNAPMSFGIGHVALALPAFMARYPELSVDLALNDRIVGLLKNPVLGRSERRIMQSWPPGGRFGAHGCCGRAAYPAKHVEPCRRPEGSQGKRRRAA